MVAEAESGDTIIPEATPRRRRLYLDTSAYLCIFLGPATQGEVLSETILAIVPVPACPLLGGDGIHCWWVLPHSAFPVYFGRPVASTLIQEVLVWKLNPHTSLVFQRGYRLLASPVIRHFCEYDHQSPRSDDVVD